MQARIPTGFAVAVLSVLILTCGHGEPAPPCTPSAVGLGDGVPVSLRPYKEPPNCRLDLYFFAELQGKTYVIGSEEQFRSVFICSASSADAGADETDAEIAQDGGEPESTTSGIDFAKGRIVIVVNGDGVLRWAVEADGLVVIGSETLSDCRGDPVVPTQIVVVPTSPRGVELFHCQAATCPYSPFGCS